MQAKPLPSEGLVDLRRRLSTLSPHSAATRQVIREAAAAYDARNRRSTGRCGIVPLPCSRVDQGMPRVLPADQLERYCEVIAALKLRTTNKQGRHLSTAEAIRLLEVHGVDTPSGFLQAPAAVLKKSTVDRY